MLLFVGRLDLCYVKMASLDLRNDSHIQIQTVYMMLFYSFNMLVIDFNEFCLKLLVAICWFICLKNDTLCPKRYSITLELTRFPLQNGTPFILKMVLE